MRARALLFPLVFGDECQDFCVERLGSEACSKGFYCKNNNDCHNLFWTSEEKGQICVFTGRGDCTNHFPLLCSEATTSTHRRQTVHGALTSPTISALRSGGPTIRAVTNYPPPNQSRVVAIELRVSRRGKWFSRPYVKLTFRNEGRHLGYYAVFDTTSTRSFILAESAGNDPLYRMNLGGRPGDIQPAFIIHHPGDPISRPARLDEGYNFVPHRFYGPGTMYYDGQRVEYLGGIYDTITVFSDQINKFTFEELYLDVVRPPGPGPIAALAADRRSFYTSAARIFAVVPSPVHDRYDVNWRLLIGHNAPYRAQVYCHVNDRNLQWFPTLTIHDFEWKINGSMWLARDRSRSDIQSIVMVLNTGGTTNRLQLSQLMMDLVIAELESFGPRRTPTVERFPQFDNCTEDSLRSAFERLILRIETNYDPDSSQHLDPLAISLPFDLEFNSANRTCTLMWETVRRGPNRVILGTPFFSSVVTVFDNVQGRIGMCQRGDNSIQDD